MLAAHGSLLVLSDRNLEFALPCETQQLPWRLETSSRTECKLQRSTRCTGPHHHMNWALQCIAPDLYLCLPVLIYINGMKHLAALLQALQALLSEFSVRLFRDLRAGVPREGESRLDSSFAPHLPGTIEILKDL